jgi:hypothetical protein
MRPIAGKSLWRVIGVFWTMKHLQLYLRIRRAVCIGDECHMTGEILVLDWGQYQLQESLRFKAHTTI